MDHGGQFEIKGRVMSQVPVDGVDLCDNLPNTEHVTAQSGNLNDTKALIQNQSEEAGGGRLVQKNFFSNSGKDEEDDEGREGYSEEEDFDEMMKDDEEEESSSLIHCQSPDTPMTDSSYSETGSLLETPYPFSPGTSPEPTSPVIPVISPQSSYPISPVDFSRSDVKVDPDVSLAFTTGPLQSNPLTPTSGTKATSPTEQECITEAKPPSSAEPVCNHKPDTSHAAPITSIAETLNTSITSTCAPTWPCASTTGPTSTGTESTFTTGPMTSSCLSVSTCSPGSIQSSALLEALEQLAQRGDDSHLPHYLHQIAEAFVLQRDYQRALWCIHLERLYHQRVLDNLNILQQQWESQCERTSSDLATQHLDPLTRVCQTHTRPRGCDAECSSLESLRPTEESDSLPSCTSGHHVDRGAEQIAKDSSRRQISDSVVTFDNLPDKLSFPDVSHQHRENPESEVEERDDPCGCQLTKEQSSDREGGEAERGVGHTTSTKGNGLHPSTAGEMDQPRPAEQQGGDLGLAEEKEAKREEEQGDVKEAAEALEMEDEGEEEDEKRKGRDSALPVDTLVSGTAGELHQEARAEEDNQPQASTETCLHQEAHLTQEAHVEQTEQEEEEEEEEYEYEVEPADVVREAASLDDMAKLITVEEMSPASGLVSILKKRSVHVHTVTSSSSSEPHQEKSTAKRRVRFKVPEDDDQEVGSSDSCLLLFLLCLVTVVISVGGTALYCALGDAHSSVCQDFSRNADFYIGQIQRGVAQIQQWFSPGL